MNQYFLSIVCKRSGGIVIQVGKIDVLKSVKSIPIQVSVLCCIVCCC